MANPPKKKGTAGETELLRRLGRSGLAFNRMPASAEYDLTNARPGVLEITPLEVLAARADRSDWLVTLRLDDFIELLHTTTHDPSIAPWETHIEVKRLARISWHTLFEKKFGG